MRVTVPLAATLAAVASATASQSTKDHGGKLYTLEIAPGQTVEVTEDEKFQMIDVCYAHIAMPD